MKKILPILILCAIAGTAFAGKTTYIYTDHRFNYIKIDEMNKKGASEMNPNHPFTFTEDQMESILREIKLNRSFLVSKEVETQDVFDDRAIRFLAPKLVEAFSKALAKDKVVFSYLTKDPKYFMRNDRLTMCTTWVHGNELHIIFDKLFAKMTMGDYDKRGNDAKAIASAKGLRISLEVRDGQMYGEKSMDELIIDTTHDFTKPATEVAATDTGTTEKTAKAVEAPKPKTTKERLKDLEGLKKDGLITDEEYKTKREEILKGL